MSVAKAPRRPLLVKYFMALSAMVIVPLLANGASEAWLGFHDRRTLLEARLQVEASSAAAKIQGFLDGIRDQMGWLVQLPWTEENLAAHRLDALRLLRQVPAIVDVTLVDGRGVERLHISRIGLDDMDSGLDRSTDPAVRG